MRVASESSADQALEVGHLFGRSTVALLEGLPAACSLTTVDHHLGDDWTGGTSADAFMDRVSPWVRDRKFVFLCENMVTAAYDGPYGFVFYDADHSEAGIRAWWDRVPLAAECVLVFDDADWDEQAVLTELGEAAGFEVVPADREWVRGDGDKGDPWTFTLQVMRRGS